MSHICCKVALEGIRFFAYHGFYPIEQVLGNEFILNVETEFDVIGSGDDELAETINYEHLYEIVSIEMRNTRKLLETVAHAILEKIQSEFPRVKTIRVAIRKMHPSLKGEVNNSLIELYFNK